MQRFATLLDRLILTPSRNGKLDLLEAWFRTVPDPDRGYGMAALTGDLAFASAKPAMLRALIGGRMDPVLFALSYDYVGDLAETIALAWPVRHGANRAPELAEVIETLQTATRQETPALVESWLDALDASGRWALLKLITGGLRIGASGRLARMALARFGGVDITAIEEIWHGLTPPYVPLFAWLEGTGAQPTADHTARFRPVMLAHALVEKANRDNPGAIDESTITPDIFAAEWKWDGIRVQASSENGTRRLYTRTGEDISHTFPDLLTALTFDGVIDGELLVQREDGSIAPFNALQQRLNRKRVTARMMVEHPAILRAYDLLQIGQEDLRAHPLSERRERLSALIVTLGSDQIDLSATLDWADLATLSALRAAPPSPEIEGVMLKRWASPYLAGRIAGHWYKWKRDPLLLDAVLMYAQRGHGRRSSLYSDFTFGLWVDETAPTLLPIGKAYFGFTDEELKELDKFVRDNTVERFGPVRAVSATRDFGLVLEIAFEGIQESPRHKSGIALRFPRINRIRWDKPTSEADVIATAKALMG
jgi:DNA ligase 1